MSRPKPGLPRLIAILALGGLVISGCGGDDDRQTAAATTTTSTASADEGRPVGGVTGGSGGKQPKPKPEPDPVAIKLAPSPVGDALFDGDDQAIYLFDVEQGSTPECYDDCAEAWPPVLAEGTPVAHGPVKQSLLGTTKREDGTTQVTYNGHPLYYYAHESPGELRCHNVPGFGGLWLALDESGDPLS